MIRDSDHPVSSVPSNDFHEKRRIAGKIPVVLRVQRLCSPAQRRAGAPLGPLRALHAGRHEPVQGPLPRPLQTRLHAGHDLPEMPPHGRYRQRRPHGLPPYVLRNAGQLQLRRLLQARSDPLGLGVPDQQAVAGRRSRPALGHDLPRRRRSGQDLARTRSSCRPIASSGWTRTRTSGRPAPPARGPTASAGRAAKSTSPRPAARSRSGTWSSRSSTASAPPPNNLRPLPSKNIDTGMGFERMASVLQGVETNYHIDILRPLVEAAGEVCRVKYEPESDSEIDRDRGRRLRRIADHVRACSFAIHENVYPDNEKQGYVIRKLIRRAVLDGYQMGIHEAFLYQLPQGRGRPDEGPVSRVAGDGRSAWPKGCGTRRASSSRSSTPACRGWSGSSKRRRRRSPRPFPAARRSTSCRPTASRRN